MRPILFTALVLAACSGDEPAPTDTETDADADTDADSDSDTDTDTDTDADADAQVYATLVRGPLFTTDLDQAQDAHDALASGGQAAAEAAGDTAHDALTGSGLLGTTEDSFLGLDRWNDADAMAAFYADPSFGAAFATLFSGPPTVEAFVQVPWHSWGSLEAGDSADPYYFAVARGHLAEEDPVAAQAAHDAVASYGEAQVSAVGDVAHIVFLGLADPREFLAVDVWSSGDAIEGVYTDPAFAAAFGSLFDNTATVQVYHSTDWHQW